MRTRSTPVLAITAAVVAFCLSVATAATLTMSDAPGARQDTAAAPVVSSVRDDFKVGPAAVLNDKTTDFDGGGGWVDDGGPTWNTFTGGAVSADWDNNKKDYVTRDSGGTGSAAIVRWLTRRTTVSVEMNRLSNNTAGGIVMGTGPGTSSGLVAAGYRNGSQFEFAIFTITGPSSLAYCSTPVAIGSSSGNRWAIEMTFDPAGAGAATAQLSRIGGGPPGTFSVASTCSTAGAGGAHSGLYSIDADNTRYDNFSATL